MLPRAELARLSLPQQLARWVGRLVAPPRSLVMQSSFTAATRWSMTGAVSAGFTLGFYLLFVTGRLWNADLSIAFGWFMFALFGVVFWFWPFLASYYMYGPLFERRILATRQGAALYGALWHTTAHCMLVHNLGGPWDAALIVPMGVGALWGSWLPAAYGAVTAIESDE